MVEKLWTVKRVGKSHEVAVRGYSDGVAYAERHGVDSLVLCDSIIVASWSKKEGLVVLNKKLAGVKP